MEDDGVTVLQEEVLKLLEDAGLPTRINDKIMTLIAEGEHEVWETEKKSSSS